MNTQPVKTTKPLNPTIFAGNQQTLVSNELSDARKTYDLEVKNTVVSLFWRSRIDAAKFTEQPYYAHDWLH